MNLEEQGDPPVGLLAHAPRREARYDNELLVHLEISTPSKDVCERGG